MNRKEFFPERSDVAPKIYAYTEPRPEYKDLLKVGYTTKSVKNEDTIF